MGLVLAVQTYRGGAPAQPLAHRFERTGGTVGRAPASDLVLADPTKYVSRSHARVEYRDGGWFLVDVGANPSIVDGRPLGSAQALRLTGGERIAIGDYTLLATLEADEPAHDATVARPTPPLQQPVPPVLPALPALPVAGLADDSLAAASILAVAGPFASFDPAADPLGLAPARPAPARHGSASDHVPPERAALAMPAAAVAIPDDYDPLADFLPPRAAAPAPAPAPAPASAPAPPAPAPIETAAPAGDAVLRALLRGLGLPDLNSRHGAEQLAELAGTLLREATAGTMAALVARTLTKRESRLDMTMIAPQANNPLKFFPDAGSALAQMLQGDAPGYLPPRQAYAGAFDDLRAHELALMAGTRAALAGVLRRFDPRAIEARLQEPTVLDKVLAANRKARMWDRMVELYGQLAAEADEDFQRLFGAAFGAAYEEQVRRLREAGRPADVDGRGGHVES